MKKIFAMIMLMVTLCGGVITGCKNNDKDNELTNETIGEKNSVKINGVEYSLAKVKSAYLKEYDITKFQYYLYIGVFINNYNDVDFISDSDIFILKSVVENSSEKTEVYEQVSINPIEVSAKSSDLENIIILIGDHFRDKKFDLFVGNVKLATIDANDVG